MTQPLIATVRAVRQGYHPITIMQCYNVDTAAEVATALGVAAWERGRVSVALVDFERLRRIEETVGPFCEGRASEDILRLPLTGWDIEYEPQITKEG